MKIGGGLQVAHSFLNELKSLYQKKIVVVVSTMLAEQLNHQAFPENFIFLKYDIPIRLKNIMFGKNSYLDNLIKLHNIDRVFTVFGPSYWKPNKKHICGYAKAQYIYTKSPFFDDIGLKERFILNIKKHLHLRDFKRNSTVLISENEDISKRLRSTLKKKVFTVTNNYNQIYDDKAVWENSILLPQFKGVYLLTIAANYPHKNLSIIPKVIEVLKKLNPAFKFKFVVTIESSVLKVEKHIAEHIIFLGRININQCPNLYEQTDFMFLPTLLECFSASYAEAMKMKKPILTSDLNFARSICGDAAVYFSPKNADDIASNIIKLAKNKVLQNQLKEEGTRRLQIFDSPKERAFKYLKIISE